MKNRKGFTLIELLAVIVILGVIMIIAIPSVTSYITNSRKDSMIADAKMFVDAAKTQLTADGTLPHSAGEKTVVAVADIALDKGGEKSPFGNDWVAEKSYVIVENVGTSSDPEYVWKVALEDVKGNCIPLTVDKSLKREVVGTGCAIEQSNKKQTLLLKITISALLDDSINFKESPTEVTSGVYIVNSTKTDANPIYYYRGVVVNNNVRFANFCWKIVRTTETGGIKLIYNGVPAQDGSCNNTGTASQLASTSKFNLNSSDNAYVGYMYGTPGASSYDATHANTNNSTIKDAIDSWYQSNMTSYTSKLEDTIWCYDRSTVTFMGVTGAGIGTEETFFRSVLVTTFKEIPSLVCTNANDRFTVSTSNGNGALTYPVGLLTIDEAALAGSGANVSANELSYLNTEQPWWLGTPGDFLDGEAFGSFLNASGKSAGTAVNSKEYGVRPSVSLKPGTEISGGNGSSATPYIVE